MVLRVYELLMKHGITPEILCVVNSDNVKYPLEVYDFFKELGAKYISFLPLVEAYRKHLWGKQTVCPCN